ncbi:MAG: lytic transglycosylase domain-containing protein [Spirochaetales bacterium]|nr:lytic transglycosylase domain-containing protein [Spirochaetales bacterium]
MRAASFSSLNRKALTLTLILLFSLSFVRCTADTVWQIPLEELRHSLARGDGSALLAAEVNRDNRHEALRLGRQAPYYLALHFRALDRPEAVEHLLRLEWEKGTAPWSEEALLELLAGLLGQERYSEVQEEASRALRRLRDPRRRFVAERLLTEALYWQQRDAEVLERLAGLRRSGMEPGGLWDDELDLFEAVAGCRLERPDWQRSFVRLFVESRVGTLHGRALSFLQLRGQLEDFLPAEQALLEAKLLGATEPARALSLLAEALPALASPGGGREYALAGELAWSSLLFETAAAGFASGEHGRASALLLGLAPLLPPGDGLYARELAGRLLRRGGQTREAAELLRAVVAASTSDSQRDRAAWFLLELARRGGPEVFAAELQGAASAWRDPSYFRDLIEEEISSLVAASRWQDMSALLAAMGPRGPAASRSRLAYLLGRAGSLGLPGAPDREQVAALLREARDADPGGYHSLLAAALIGAPSAALPPHDEPDETLSAPPASGAWPGAQADSADAHDRGEGAAPAEAAGSAQAAGSARAAGWVQAAELVRGYLAFGLVAEGYALLTRRADGLLDGERTLELPAVPDAGAFPVDLLREAARDLNERGEYLRSIRLINRYLARSQGAPEALDFELLYPRGYGSSIQALAERYGIARELFYALVREESHFDPHIVSRSGAVGLTQLMGETAADSARRLRLESYDLRDPDTNLRLGAEHFSRLASRLQSIPKALMAYNAGLSRVRSWERRYGSLPVDLLVEAVPFPETRGYVRKILVSAAQYGRLYYGLDLQAVALRFYPELRAEGDRQR